MSKLNARTAGKELANAIKDRSRAVKDKQFQLKHEEIEKREDQNIKFVQKLGLMWCYQTLCQEPISC